MLCNLVHYVPILSQRILVCTLSIAHFHYDGALIALKSHQFACCDLIVHTSDGDAPKIWKEHRGTRALGCWEGWLGVPMLTLQQSYSGGSVSALAPVGFCYLLPVSKVKPLSSCTQDSGDQHPQPGAHWPQLPNRSD